jgi:5-hydroxyisourate hydrolase
MISTHVLDTELGQPRAGLKVCLYRGDELIAEQSTDEDGRIAELAPDVGPGDYRLVFHVGGEFFDRIELALKIADPDRDYHVPLLISPYQCTSYRGS